MILDDTYLTYQTRVWDISNTSLKHIKYESETFKTWAWDISNTSLRHIKHEWVILHNSLRHKDKESERYQTWAWDTSNMSLRHMEQESETPNMCLTRIKTYKTWVRDILNIHRTWVWDISTKVEDISNLSLSHLEH